MFEILAMNEDSYAELSAGDVWPKQANYSHFIFFLKNMLNQKVNLLELLKSLKLHFVRFHVTM